MRTVSEMMDLILNVAKNDGRIRAVQMQGSRTNNKVKADIFQDFDICYYVNDILSFKKNPNWIDIFGDRLMLQMPEINQVTDNGIIVYLMLFTDWNRIDLVLIPMEMYKNDENNTEESEALLLFAKDDIFKPFPPATHKVYNTKPPIDNQFYSVCNEFWWGTQYVAKGIYRNELPYVKYFLDKIMRDEFHKMIEWYIGQKANYSVSAGKYGRYFKLYLDNRQYKMFCKTYVNNEYENIWDAMFIMCDLFREFSEEVAKYNNFIYPKKDDENMTLYLKDLYVLCNKNNK